ncbi:hypothetical protein V5P93_000348 [Actinokineospora auranticolor]|uniref:Uncharacterized protein n=1 Tax=Actinokineospora auranticolor TaxID=155976 RepID=A0A2S6GKN2_9PSEU|nr:hypothetical protein [Actinokineospora auranticolor]PPK65765.1 hypothetical protein CLV40_11224 [Actinokineospora auranticolor]
MKTAGERIEEIADCEFTGDRVAERIARYAQLTQRLAHDLARELDIAEEAAEAALRRLKGHPLLVGIDVRLRARKVARELREARDLCKGISAEAVAFNLQFRREFAEALDPTRAAKTKHHRGEVDL